MGRDDADRIRHDLYLTMRAALLVVALMALSASARAQHRAGWGGVVSYGVEAFRSDREAWQRSRVTVQRRFSEGAASLEAGHWRRNGETAPFAATDLYRSFGRAGYGNLRAQVAPGATAIARSDLLGEGYLALGGGWEGSLGVRHLTFEANTVTLGTGSLARYAGNWLVRVRAVVDPAAVTGVSTALSARHLFDGTGGLTAPFAEVRLGQGQEPIVAPDGTAAIRQSWGVSVRAQHPVLGRVGLSFGTGYTIDGTLSRWHTDLGVAAAF